MSQHHFIIKYDTEKKEWEWDVETEHARFPDGTIYDDENGWNEVGKVYATLDNEACEELSKAVFYLNKLGDNRERV